MQITATVKDISGFTPNTGNTLFHKDYLESQDHLT